ncbi:MAG: hypothetical protein E3J72_14580 [Planctomycetota bacterium]|nr:MAG: hypothetical protein E3J72_14580 [Planctomycetota bacterium]
MIHRTTGIFIAVLGLLVVVILILIRFDIHLAAKRGPRWKRNLVTAGILAMSLLGLTIPNVSCTNGKDSTTVTGRDGKKTGDEGRPEEQSHLESVWSEATEIASGKRGAYPFDKKGKKKILAELEKAKTDIDTLESNGTICGALASILRKDLAVFVVGVNEKQPTELRPLMCYSPKMFLPAKASMKRLTERMPLLEKLLAREKVNKALVSKVLENIEKEISILEQEHYIRMLTPDEKTEAEELKKKAASQIEKIRAKLESKEVSLKDSGDIKTIEEALNFAKPFADSGKSTTAQRKSICKKLDEADKAAGQLSKAGLISIEEAELIQTETARVRNRVLRNPPTDNRIMCYDMMFVYPSQKSMNRISKRLPLLKRIVKDGKVAPEVIKKVLPSIEKDIETLSSEKELKHLQADKQSEATSLRDDMKKVVSEIKNIMNKKK